MASGKSAWYRIQPLPANWTLNELLDSLRGLCQDNERAELRILGSLSPLCYPPGSDQVAIVQFHPEAPSFLAHVIADRTGSVEFQFVVGSTTVNIDKNFFGLTQMFKPVEKDEINLDIVAICGLDGHAYGSWKSRNPVDTMWLKDFLKDDMPQCRVMTYGYNSKLTSNRAYTFEDFCDRFLEEILLARSSSDEERSRRLILVGHSYGCRIITKALIKCKLRDRDPNYKALLNATRAVVFFGAPHRGIDTTDTKDYLTTEFPESTARMTIISELERDDKLGLQNAKDFADLVGSFVVISLYERKPTRKLVRSDQTTDPGGSATGASKWSRSGPEFYPLLEDSALLNLPWPLEIPIPTESDHSNMAKFDYKDSTYRLLLGHLKSIEKGAKPGSLFSEFLYLGPRPAESEVGKDMRPSQMTSGESSMLTMAMVKCSKLMSQKNIRKKDIDLMGDLMVVLAKARSLIVLAESIMNEKASSGSSGYAYSLGSSMASYGKALEQLIDNLEDMNKGIQLYSSDAQQTEEPQGLLNLRQETAQASLLIEQINNGVSQIVPLGNHYLFNCQQETGSARTSERIETLAKMSVAREDLYPVMGESRPLQGSPTKDLWVPYESLYFQTQTSESTSHSRGSEGWLEKVVSSFTKSVASNLQHQPRRFAVLKSKDRLEQVMVEFRPYPKNSARPEYYARRWQIEQIARMLKVASSNNTAMIFPSVPLLYLSETPNSSTPCFLFIYSASGVYGLDEIIEHFRKHKITPSIKERLAMATGLVKAIASLHISGIVHGRINLANIYIRFQLPGSNKKEVSLEDAKLENGTLLVAGFEVARQFAQNTDKIDVEDSDLRIYLHENRLQHGKGKSIQYPAHDVFSLGIVMLELGLWKQVRGYSGYQKASSELERRKFVISLRRLFKDDGGLGENMGSEYGAVISYCLGKSGGPEQKDTGDTESPLGTPNAIHVTELLSKLVSATPKTI